MQEIHTFRDLRRILQEQGCFNREPWRDVLMLVLNLSAAASCFYLSAWSVGNKNTLTGICLFICLFVLGSLFFYRLGWLMHNGAHNGVYTQARSNQIFTRICAGILGEFPSGWKHGHNRHHSYPNVIGVDGDQAERWDPKLRHTSRILAGIDLFLCSHYKGRRIPTSLLLLGIRDGVYAYQNARPLFWGEFWAVLAGLTGQWLFFSWCFAPLATMLSVPAGLLGAGLWLLNLSLGMIYLNAFFAGNHYDREFFSEEEGKRIEFCDLQIRTARNYQAKTPAGAFLMRFLAGGLEYQIEHHLFPDMPPCHFAKAAPYVRQFCQTRGLLYDEMPFLEAMRHVIDFHMVDVKPQNTP